MKKASTFIANVDHIINVEFKPEEPSKIFEYKKPGLFNLSGERNRQSGYYMKQNYYKISNIFEFIKDDAEKHSDNLYKIVTSDKSGGPDGTVYKNAGVELTMIGGNKIIYFNSNEEALNFIKELAAKNPKLIEIG